MSTIFICQKKQKCQCLFRLRMVQKWDLDVFEGAKWVSLTKGTQNIPFPATHKRNSGQIGHEGCFLFCPIWPEFRLWVAGNWIFWIPLIKETHFAPSNKSVSHFWTILSLNNYWHFCFFWQMEIVDISRYKCVQKIRKRQYWWYCWQDIFRRRGWN